MNTKVYSILLFSLVVVSGCVEELSPNLDQWTKIVGSDLTSWAEEIYIEENGDVFVFGSVGTDAGGLENIGASVTRLDLNGNFIERRVYPLVETIDATGAGFLPINVSNSARIRDVRSLTEGGFLLLGVFDEVTVEDGAGRSILVSLPFYMVIDEHLDQQHYFNLNPELATTSGPVRIQSWFYDTQDGSFGIRSRLYAGSPQPIGYSLISLNQEGLPVLGDISSSDEQFFGSIRSVDHVFYKDGSRYTLGQRGNEFTIDDENGNMVANLGFGGLTPFNDNALFFQERADASYLIVYSHPMSGDDEIRTLIIDQDFIIREESNTIIVEDDEFVKGFIPLSNGNFAIYNINIKDIEPSATLYLMSPTFRRLKRWQLSGPPGSIAEDQDGNLIVAYNPVYNNQVVKSTIMKIPASELF